MAENKVKKDDLETMFEKLELVIKALEQDDLSLEKSFQFYNQGMKTIEECNKTIDQIEKLVMVLDENGN